MWKHAYYGGALIDALLTPFPGNWPGTNEFDAALRAYRDTHVFFPLSLAFPSGPGTVTTVLGLGLFLSMIALWSPKNYKTVLLVAAATVVAVLGALFGQRNARFLLEPYLWLLMATAIQWKPSRERTARWVSGAVTVQSILVLVMIGIGIVTLTSGAVSAPLREETMDRHANGHTTMKWVDSVLPTDARLIVEPRSIALVPRFAIANDWRRFVPPGTSGAQVYAELVKRQRPGFMLVRVAVGERPFAPECMKEIYAGPFRAEEALRNRLIPGANTMPGYCGLIRLG